MCWTSSKRLALPLQWLKTLPHLPGRPPRCPQMRPPLPPLLPDSASCLSLQQVHGTVTSALCKTKRQTQSVSLAGPRIPRHPRHPNRQTISQHLRLLSDKRTAKPPPKQLQILAQCLPNLQEPGIVIRVWFRTNQKQ